tara:strand:+ start:120 stop:1154 length:1035 start_codon:yes stop_codon:yes gene_type:complete
MKNNIDINWEELGFNIVNTKSMYFSKCKYDGSWEEGNLIPFGNIELSPAAGVLNYGQGVFEGTKSFRTKKNKIVLFRPDMNAKRIKHSSRRLCIPEMSEPFFLKSVVATVKDNIDYIPPLGKGSLYIRPIIWGTSPILGVGPAEEYTFLIYVCPVGPYFKKGIKPLDLIVTTDFHRAAPKGIGNAKAIGNYSASLFPVREAKKRGYDEVIYLDASNENLIEEVGSANIFIVKDSILKTPRLNGSILPGITRDSVIKIATDLFKMKVEEIDVSLTDVLNADEVFCVGTAVVITPVGSITYKTKKILFNNGGTGNHTMRLREKLIQIQNQEIEDPFGWIYNLQDKF